MQKIQPAELKKDIEFLFDTLESVHPNLYAYTSKSETIIALTHLKKGLTMPLTKLEFYQRLAPIVTKLRDGHTSINIPTEEYVSFIEESGKFFPFDLVFFQRKAYVKQNYSNENIPIGTELISINGIAMSEIIKGCLAYISGELEEMRMELLTLYFRMLLCLIYNFAGYFDIEYIDPEGRLILRRVNGVENSVIEQIRKEEEEVPSFAFEIDLEVRAGIMEIRAFQDLDSFKPFCREAIAAMEELDIEHLIIDLRKNWGGDSRIGDELLRYISYEPFRQYSAIQLKASQQIKEYYSNNEFIRSYYESFVPKLLRWLPLKVASPVYRKVWRAKEGELIKIPCKFQKLKKGPLFEGYLYALTSPNTYSSAASFVTAIRDFRRGRLIGETMGGLATQFGDLYLFQLPHSGLDVRVSHKEHIRPNGVEALGRINPDYVVSVTLEEKLGLEDQTLEYAKKMALLR